MARPEMFHSRRALYSLPMRLILFDIDGTLISAKGAGKRALERALEAHYGIASGMRGVALEGKTDPLIVREALALAGRRENFDGRLSPVFRKIYADFLREELASLADFEILPGVIELIARLTDQRDVLLGLATGNVQEGAWLKLERAGLRAHFSVGGYGSDAEDRTEVVRRAVERARACLGDRTIRRTVVIGDTPRDIHHGRLAGADTVAVATGSYSLEELRSHSPGLAVLDLRPGDELLDFLDRGKP